MSDFLIEILLFGSKTFIIFLFVLFIFIAFFMLLAQTKEKLKGQISVKNINKKYTETMETIFNEILPKKSLRALQKKQKASKKLKNKAEKKLKTAFVINFNGDIKASAVSSLREEITAILNTATLQDEVILRLESPGGMVHAYGLAAAQLMRLRAKKIPLTIAIDKVAASGGYLMACVADKILSAPYAIIGSIGVIVQLPNFHRLLKEKNIDFEQHTAGNYKRTLTIFGENTDAGREKLHEELEDIHGLFKDLILEHRPQIDIEAVATGEHWLGKQALELKLIDEITTSDDYLLELSKTANLFELKYERPKTFSEKISNKWAAFLQAIKHYGITWL